MFVFIAVFIFKILLYLLTLIEGLRYSDTCLPELGLRINKTLSNPWGTNDQLLRDIYVYFEELDGIRKELKKGILNGLDPTKDLPQQFKKYQEVNETGGPIHLQSILDIKPLIKFYRWNTDNISEFYELLQFTRDAWVKLQSLFQSEEKRPPLTFKEKVKLNMWKDKG